MLEIRGAWKTFNGGTPNEVRALRGVNLSIDEGSFVVVIGTNGSGKSTLLNAVAGTFLLDAGALKLDGIDVTAWPEHRRAALIGTDSVGAALAGTIMGSVLFRLIVALALRWGLNPNDLKLITAGFVFVALVLPSFIQKMRARTHRHASV